MLGETSIRHWEYTETVGQDSYDSFVTHSTPILTSAPLPANTAVYVQNFMGGKRLEGIYESGTKSIRPLKNKTAPNKDLRLYLDAIQNEEITMIAVDGLMGTGKTSTCIQELVRKHLAKVHLPKDLEGYKIPDSEHKILIAKPHIGACGEDYGALPGDIDEKLSPTLTNYIQYFDRFHKVGFHNLRRAGYIDILPLGFVRGLDAQNMTVIVDEAQNTKELISIATRKAEHSRIFFLGDTSPFQIDTKGNTPKKNGLTNIIDLLAGAPYFQYIEMKSIEHILRSEEVRDVVRRLFKKHGKNPQDWIV